MTKDKSGDEKNADAGQLEQHARPPLCAEMLSGVETKTCVKCGIILTPRNWRECYDNICPDCFLKLSPFLVFAR